MKTTANKTSKTNLSFFQKFTTIFFGNQTNSFVQNEIAGKGNNHIAESAVNKENVLISNLYLYYFGESIPILDATQKMVGSAEQVAWEIYQPEVYEGTDYHVVNFNVRGNSPNLRQLSFDLLINKRNGVVIEATNIYINRNSISQKELVGLLGGRDLISFLEKKFEVTRNFETIA